MEKADPAGGNSTSSRRILAIFNPAAGRNQRARFDQVVARLRAAGCEVSVRATNAPGHAEEIAAEVSPAVFDIVAAAGGDGTINEIVNGLRGTGVALGIIPLGTANVLADEIGLSKNIAKVAQALAAGPITPIRVGVANGRRFVMMAGVGFDANVIRGVSLRLKKILGPFAYVWSAATQAFRDPFASCAVVIDGEEHRSVSAVACNGRLYGGPFTAAPKACLTDGSFQVVLMKGRGWFSVVRYGAGLMLGRVGAWPDVSITTARDVVITGTTGQAVQADGDIITVLPVRISIDPEPVGLVYPSEI